MKKELNRFERIADGAYFAVDTRVFESTITSYDPILAHQTLLTTPEEAERIEVDRPDENSNIPLHS